MIYRAATPADGPALAAMARTIWIATFAHGSSAEDSAAYLAKTFGPGGELIAALGRPDTDVRLAMAGEAIAGFAKLEPNWLPEPEPGTLQLGQFYVASDWHGRGVARALLDWACARARERGAKALVLTVWEENPRAIRFYTREGFVHVGDYGFAVGAQVDRDLVMRLAL